MNFASQIKKKLLEPKGILFVLLLLLTVLRLPNFAEPYWYGDEGIYLTIGTALREGSKLYTTIVDHKTPLIYYLAMVGNQLNFRLLLYGMMLLSTAAFFALCRTLFTRLKPAAVATFLFVIFTSLPWFEGNIPNGELFVISFVLYGAWLLMKAPTIKTFFLTKVTKQQNDKLLAKEKALLFLAGFSFGLALLTKVPALFDIVAFGLIFVFLSWRERLAYLQKRFWAVAFFAGGCLLPLLLSVLYFLAIGSGTDYLNFGLLYNFKYANSWKLPFTNPIGLFIFSFAGKTLILSSTLLILLGLSRKISATVQFSLSWFWLALFASLLSNRPYPHYFLQVIPPATLLVALLTTQQRKITKTVKLYLSGSLVALLVVLGLLHVGFYRTISYYSNWLRFTTKAYSREEYYQTFNELMSDNYAVAKLITTSRKKPSLFIWGTDPMLYALTKTVPPTRFTVSFHIADLDAYQQTMQDIRTAKPEYIIVMKNETHELPGLYSLLTNQYSMNTQYRHFTLWKKMSQPISLLY